MRARARRARSIGSQCHSNSVAPRAWGGARKGGHRQDVQQPQCLCAYPPPCVHTIAQPQYGHQRYNYGVLGALCELMRHSRHSGVLQLTTATVNSELRDGSTASDAISLQCSRAAAATQHQRRRENHKKKRVQMGSVALPSAVCHIHAQTISRVQRARRVSGTRLQAAQGIGQGAVEGLVYTVQYTALHCTGPQSKGTTVYPSWRFLS